MKPPASDVTFAFEELDAGRCRFHFRIRGKDRSFASRLELAAARPFVIREWRRHFAALDRILREESDRLAREGSVGGS